MKADIRFGIFEPWKFVTWTFHGMSHFLGKELDQRCVRCVHWSCQVNSNQTFWHLHEPVRPLTSVSSTVRSADSFHLSSLTVHVALMERLAMTRFPSRGPLQQSTSMLILCGSWLKAFHHCWIIESVCSLRNQDALPQELKQFDPNQGSLHFGLAWRPWSCSHPWGCESCSSGLWFDESAQTREGWKSLSRHEQGMSCLLEQHVSERRMWMEAFCFGWASLFMSEEWQSFAEFLAYCCEAAPQDVHRHHGGQSYEILRQLQRKVCCIQTKVHASNSANGECCEVYDTCEEEVRRLLWGRSWGSKEGLWSCDGENCGSTWRGWGSQQVEREDFVLWFFAKRSTGHCREDAWPDDASHSRHRWRECQSKRDEAEEALESKEDDGEDMKETEEDSDFDQSLEGVDAVSDVVGEEEETEPVDDGDEEAEEKALSALQVRNSMQLDKSDAAGALLVLLVVGATVFAFSLIATALAYALVGFALISLVGCFAYHAGRYSGAKGVDETETDEKNATAVAVKEPATKKGITKWQAFKSGGKCFVRFVAFPFKLAFKAGKWMYRAAFGEKNNSTSTKKPKWRTWCRFHSLVQS